MMRSWDWLGQTTNSFGLSGILVLICSFGGQNELGASEVYQAHSLLETNDSRHYLEPNTESPVWSIEVGSGAWVSNVREHHLDGYTLVPIELTVSHFFNTVWLENFLGGAFECSPEGLVRGYHTFIVHGIESRLDGLNLGLRCNFRNCTKRLTPFAEASVGLAFADSRPLDSNRDDRGLGQDFNFNFTTSVGLSYAIDKRWFVRLEGIYSHYSNAGLSEPRRDNRQIDAAGGRFSIGWRF